MAAGGATNSVVGIQDLDTGVRVGVETIDGKNRMLTDTLISSVNVPLGKDPLPDTFFEILTAGSIGDTITVDIAATANDSTTPDSDFPAYTYVYTLTAPDVGDEATLALNLADALNADPLFEAQSLEAYALTEDDDNKRPIIHVSSTKFSLNGEFYERPNIGDFEVTTTGTTSIQFYSSSYRSIVSRPKEVSLARDPRNPHRLGVQNISGTVFIRSSDPATLFRSLITEVGNPTNDDLNVNGSGTPVVFEFNANPAGGTDKIIDSLKFYGSDGNIKVQFGAFFGINSALTNGILIEFIRDGFPIFSQNILNTPEFLAFSTSASDNKIIGASAGDFIESTFSLVDKNLAFVLRNGENDLIRVTIRDNLSAVSGLHLQIEGSED